MMDCRKMLLSKRIQAALERATKELLAARTADGHWEGELSSSSLSTATAVIALAVTDRESKVESPKSKVQSPKSQGDAASELQIQNFKSQIAAGLAWLPKHSNA